MTTTIRVYWPEFVLLVLTALCVIGAFAYRNEAQNRNAATDEREQGRAS